MIEARGSRNRGWGSRDRNSRGLNSWGGNNWGLDSWGHNDDWGRRRNYLPLNGRRRRGAKICNVPLGVRTSRVRPVSDYDGLRVGRPCINHTTGATYALTNNEEVREHWRCQHCRDDGDQYFGFHDCFSPDFCSLGKERALADLGSAKKLCKVDGEHYTRRNDVRRWNKDRGSTVEFS